MALNIQQPNETMQDVFTGENKLIEEGDTRLAAEEARVKALGEKNEQLFQQSVAPAMKDVETAMGASKPERPAHEPLPTFHAHEMDAKKFQDFSNSLLGFALIAGSTRGHWMDIGRVLSGAVRGYYEGDREKAQDEFTKFQTDFKTAIEKEKRINDEYDKILEDRKLSINEKLQLLKVKSIEYDHQDRRYATEVKSLDKHHEQQMARKQSVEQLKEKAIVAEQIRQQMADFHREAHADRMALRGAAGGEGVKPDMTKEDMYSQVQKFGVTPAAFEHDVDAYNTDGTLPSVGRSQKMLPYIAMVKNRQAQKYADSNPRVNKIETAGLSTEYRQNQVRAGSIERLVGSIDQLKPRITDLTKKLAPSGSERLNMSVNDFRRKYGDNAELQELHNLVASVALHFQEVLTMPGSNAQMHASSQQAANDMLNDNMPIGKVLGAFKGIEEDNRATLDNIKRISKQTLDQARNVGKSTEDKTVHWDDLK